MAGSVGKGSSWYAGQHDFPLTRGDGFGFVAEKVTGDIWFDARTAEKVTGDIWFDARTAGGRPASRPRERSSGA